MKPTLERADVRPYMPNPGDLCARCVSKNFPLVARRFHASGWVINLCKPCLTLEESVALNGVLDEGLYLSGLR